MQITKKKLLGIWKYLNGYTREIAEDGQVTLRLGEDVIWKRRCISKSENEFVLEGMGHSDLTLTHDEDIVLRNFIWGHFILVISYEMIVYYYSRVI